MTRVLLVNGWSANKSMWDDISRDLSDFGVHLEVMDLDYVANIEAFAQVLEKKVDNDCVLAGWSLGGQIVLSYLLSQPNKALLPKGAVLFQSTPKFISDSCWSFGCSQSDFDTLQALCEAAELDKLNRLFSYLLVKGSCSYKQELKSLKSLYRVSQLPSQDVLLSGLSMLQHNDMTKDIGDIHIPVMWILGQADSLIQSDIEMFLSNKTQHRIEIITGLGHYPGGENWLKIRPKFLQFFNECGLNHL